MSPVRTVLLLTSWAGLLCTLPARADEESVTARLEWSQEPGTETCLDGSALKRAVNQRWDRNVFVETTSPDIVLRGMVARRPPNAWTVSLALYRADGTSLGSRQLVTAAPSCSSLDDSVALAVGLMLDLSRHRIVEERRASAAQAGKSQEGGQATTNDGAQTTPAKQAAPAAATQEPVIDGPTISIPEDTQPSRAPWQAGPSAGMEAALGFLPSVGVAPRVGLTVDPPRFVPLEVAVSVFLVDKEGTSRGARFSAWSVEIGVCPISVRRPTLRADSCVTERLGEVRAAGFGFTDDLVATELVSTIGAREVGTLRLVGPLSAFAGLAVEAPVVRYRFVFGDSSGNPRVVHRMAPVVGAGTLGLSLEW